ncbi:MAG TPA: hypothetical protein EYP55_09090, partial [Anaerolineae bacterium]|nr:hypothetical protein [Anaerolineae bacterium]
MSGLTFDSTSKAREAMRKAALVAPSLLLFALAILLLQWAPGATAQPQPLHPSPLSLQEPPTHTLRVHGGPGWPDLPGNRGAGSGVITDTITGLLAEDQPYTDTVAIFNPQRPQAPQKDSITWNPLFMSETETEDENQRQGLYVRLIASDINASEKVWFRMWYEPEHWDKDLDGDGEFDRDPSTGEPTDVDEWYPAIMQEFT